MSTADFTAALKAVRQASDLHAEFTTDDVWPLLDVAPGERNVIGKAFSEACRRGLIVGTDRFVKSNRTESKGRRVQVWRKADPPDQGGLFA